MRSVYKSILDAVLGSYPCPQKLLDLGSGDGSFTRVLAGALPETAITAVDTVVSKRFIATRGITFALGSAEELPFESESFDIVVAALSLHHWDNKEKGCTEVYRVLRKGGLIVIGDPMLEDWLSNRFWGWLAQKIDGGSFTDPGELKRCLGSAGFSSTTISLIPNSMRSIYLITARK